MPNHHEVATLFYHGFASQDFPARLGTKGKRALAEFSGRDLVCVRGERTVFTNLAFRLTSGGALVLVGPNGSGKSSLLRMMAGLLAPAAGILTWDGAKVTGNAERHGSRTRYVGHADAVKSALTVAENLRTWAVLWGGFAGAEHRGSKALAAFGIDRLADVPGRYLSAGQKRRLALARLLVAPAPLWLLDEPRAGLDADAEIRFDLAVERHRTSGGMVVMALHGDRGPPGARTLDLAGAVSAC
jgi:heme exporter protein A